MVFRFRRFDLPAIPHQEIGFLKGVKVPIGKLQNLFVHKVRLFAFFLELFSQQVEIILPNLKGTFLVETGVIQTEVDARFEGPVNVTDSVGGEKKDTLQVC